MCGGMRSAHLKFNVPVETIIGVIEEGTHGLCKGFFFPGTGDYCSTEPDDPRVNMVKVEITHKTPEGEYFPTIETYPRVEVLVPIEVVDINPIKYTFHTPAVGPNKGVEQRYYQVKTFEEL